MDRFLLIAVPLLFVAAILWWLRNRRVAPPLPGADLLATKPIDLLLDKIDSTPDSPISFGYKMSWLAIKASDAESVLESLSIQNVQPANWHTGFVAAYNGRAFVSPTVNGWVFVVSQTLPELGSDSDTDDWASLLSSLSRKHGNVQYFSTHRVVDFHAWARFTNGNETRAFAYLGERGEILADRGERSAGEAELGYAYFDPDSPDATSESYWERDDLCYPDEEHVMEVAGKWSINPNSLEELGLPQGVGWIGNLVRASD